MNPKLTFLTLCALSVSALNVLAQNLVVTSDTTVSGTHYENNSTTYAALTNSGTWTFTGSDVTLTGTADSGNGGYGVRNTGGGTVNLIDGVIEANAGGVLQSNTSAAVLRNVNITTQSGPGVTMSTSSTATISGGTITTNSGGNGVTLTTQSGVTLRDVTVNAFNQGVGLSGTSTAELHDVNITAANSHAVALSTSSTVVMVGGTIVTTSTGAHHGVNAGTQSSVSLENVVIISANGRGISLTGTSTAVLDNVNITTNNSEAITAIGIAINTGTLTARDVTLTTSGSNSAGMTIVRASFYGEDLTINTTGAMARGFRFEVGSTGTINGLQITTQGDYAHGFTVNGDNIDTLTVLHINDAQVQTSGYSAHGVTIGGDLESELYMENSTITASGEGSNGIYFSTTGTSVETVTLTNVTVTAQNSGISVGTSKITDTPSNYENLIDRTGTYAVLLHSSTISGGAHLININTVLSGTNEAGEIVLVDNPVALTTAAENSTLIGDTLTSGSAALAVDLNNSTLTGNIIGNNDSQITLSASNGATVTGNITASNAAVINLILSGNDTTMTGTLTGNSDSTLEVTVNDGSTITGDFTASDNSSLNLGINEDGTIIGSITGTGSSTLAVTVSEGGVLTGNITTSEDNITTVNISDGGTITGDLTASDNSDLTLDLSENGTVIGNITGSGSSTLAVTVSDSGTLAGNITTSDDNITTVNISDGGTITGDLTSTGNSDLTLDLSENGAVIGSITGSGSSTLDITVSDSGTLAGSITTSEDNTTTGSISDGGAIIGDLTGSDNSTLAVTVGDGGTLTGALNGEQVTVTVDSGGNVTINKDSDFNSLDNSGNVTVDTGSVIITNPITGNGTTTINDSGNLTASFDGGNGALVINPGGGVNLTQDSNLGAISNDGTLNVGDYQVSVSDLTNDGTIAIAVNTDSGAHGTLHVTGSSSGAGTIHVTSTGDGQANPNDVLGNLVTGNGTANYTWDEVDWGLEELIVTPNPDGTITVKEDGTSPAGAVLNSAIAVQQSLWFAQQNSLLKRMGELRYGARASRPLADKDVRVPYHSLIENIWLRSYGQQLNVGSQVSGKAYEQLIYGVDLGTDHKFTISADSDLYLGVYAGYGRSDLDYRTPGADGEINSYYGGLYATWLHSSGFYIDATVKAASVDNDLKAPYGSTQLTANYSDVNIGGSIEIGKKFTFADAWFIEPQLQVNYLHILAEDYTAGHMNLKAQDLDALQLRIGSLFGRTINLTNSGALQPYVKISGVETISSGGTLRNGYQHTRANTDGARAELGGGIIWQLDANNQLHLDYEASFGDKYDKPWGLTAGYRHQF